MSSKFEELCKNLESIIEETYTSGISLEEAEKLAARFLHAQLQVSVELKKADLDARMRKSGVKAIRAAIYLEIIRANEKKPTEAQIASTVETDKIVMDEQESLDKAEVNRDDLERYYNVFGNAHIYYRGVSKGRFE